MTKRTYDGEEKSAGNGGQGGAANGNGGQGGAASGNGGQGGAGTNGNGGQVGIEINNNDAPAQASQGVANPPRLITTFNQPQIGQRAPSLTRGLHVARVALQTVAPAPAPATATAPAPNAAQPAQPAQHNHGPTQ